VVWVQIRPTRQLDQFGHLDTTGACLLTGGCAFSAMHRWAGHPGLWIYTPQTPVAPIPHFWATTPGTYYWQAYVVSTGTPDIDQHLTSPTIGSFHVS